MIGILIQYTYKTSEKNAAAEIRTRVPALLLLMARPDLNHWTTAA